MRELFDRLNEKYNLDELLSGDLDIFEVLEDEIVVDFVKKSRFSLDDIENYLVKHMK